jgi:hypothetical protein
MSYALGMRTRFVFITAGIVFMFVAVFCLRADELQMQNGERFLGKVLFVSAGTVVLESETLGRISVPRKKVAILAFGTNTLPAAASSNVSHVSGTTNLPSVANLVVSAKTNADLSATLHLTGLDTNFIQQIRNQMLGGSPAAASKYDAMVSGLLNGSFSLDDLRREAQSSADQLRELKRELGPDAGDSLDGYMDVLDNFLKETATESTNAAGSRVSH